MMNEPPLFTIRPADGADAEAIRKVHRAAFEREDEARLVDRLQDGGHVEISLIAETREIVGHILFSALRIATNHGDFAALTLAPVAVLPECQRHGIGSALVWCGLETARQRGDRVVIVLGEPAFYGRFGFRAELIQRLSSPYACEAWLGCELAPGALRDIVGEAQYPPPFNEL